MAGYIKEMLMDIALVPLGNMRNTGEGDMVSLFTIEDRFDIEQAIVSLFRAGIFSKDDLAMLTMLLQGYAIEEISLEFPNQNIECNLTRMLKAIEEQSDITDMSFMRKVKNSGKYPKSKMKDLEQYLRDNEKIFIHKEDTFIWR